MEAARDVDQLFATVRRGDGELMIVAAHPDDDVIGAGALMARIPRVRVVYATDGAPRDGRDARAHGFADVAAYAAARQREARAALAHGRRRPGLRRLAGRAGSTGDVRA